MCPSTSGTRINGIKVLGYSAREGSTEVKQLTCDPEVKGSNPSNPGINRDANKKV